MAVLSGGGGGGAAGGGRAAPPSPSGAASTLADAPENWMIGLLELRGFQKGIHTGVCFRAWGRPGLGTGRQDGRFSLFFS